MLATTSAFRSESPVFCISTVTAIPRTVPSCVSHRKQHLPHLGFGLRIPADQLTELEYHLRLLFGKHVVLSGMPHKRGNPNWGRPIPLAPALATAFEMQVRRLRLTPDTYLLSDELRGWCERNRNRFYIPEWLLDMWDIPVDPNLSSAA